MEEGFPKDTKDYVVCICSKCGEYFYVKTTQKNKKCVRCGRVNIVKEIVSKGEIVQGMTAASLLVRAKQNDLAIQKLGKAPALKAEGEKQLGMQKHKKTVVSVKNSQDLEQRFLGILAKLSKVSKKVPYYAINLTFKQENIPPEEIKVLFSKFVQAGKIKKLIDNYYSIEL